ncbi:Gfo/Idh/MocA family protein [Ammoniphilus oxalaticus]|nr:Gfo/Idh/MocA family oxidoreductase [Ammoniphilus oxalaticus]
MPIRVAIIGAGDRGNTYSRYALQEPAEMKVVAVAEPNAERRAQFAQTYGLTNDSIYDDWEDLLNRPKFCDAVIVTTQDRMHFAPTMKALRSGYATLVEKPLSPSLDECNQMIDLALETDQLFMLGYVLRFTPFFQKIKKLLDQKAIGVVRHISLDVNVAYWHYAHSFARGNWNRSEQSSPMILAKCCHDFDILLYLLNERCAQLTSFGSLAHFKADRAPIGSSDRCLDGCEVEQSCPFSAKRLYLGEYTGWPVSTISQDLSLGGRREAIEMGPYGRCVYRCDNDVVDNQSVLFQFENGATATLTMSAFTEKLTRQIRILGTEGEISGVMEQQSIQLTRFGQSTETIQLKSSSFGKHAGGDYGLIRSFTQSVRENRKVDLRSLEIIRSSHQLAAFAEQSRLTGKTIEVRSQSAQGTLASSY